MHPLLVAVNLYATFRLVAHYLNLIGSDCKFSERFLAFKKICLRILFLISKRSIENQLDLKSYLFYNVIK